MNILRVRRREAVPDRAERQGNHPELPGKTNRNLAHREIRTGLSPHLLPVGAVLDVRTQHRTYRIVNREGGRVLIAGHPEYCPTPVVVQLSGSTWGGSMIKSSYIGKGMCLEFRHPVHGVVVTSPIQEILAWSESVLEGTR